MGAHKDIRDLTGNRYGLHMCHIRAFIILIMCTGSLAVRVHVTSPVVVKLPAHKLTLPCQFQTQATNSTLCVIIWERGLRNPSTIFSGYFTDAIAHDPSSNSRVRLGNGCSAELDDPSIRDTDMYRVKLVCHEDGQFEDSAVVNVTILPKNTPTTLIMLETSYSEKATHSMTPTQDEEETVSKAVIILLVFAGIAVVGLVTIVIMFYSRKGCFRDHERGIPDISVEGKPLLNRSLSHQETCKTAEKHVQTSLFVEALNRLNETRWLTLLGNPGDGISTILKQISLEYGKRGFLTVGINCITEIRNHDTKCKHVLFVCRCPDKVNFNTDVWRGIEEYLSTDSKKNVKLLSAFRFELWSQHKSVLESIAIFKNTLDVRSERLTYEDKVKLIDEHVGNKIPLETKSFLAQKYSFAFPECCRFASQCHGDTDFSDIDKVKQIFSSPLTFVQKQLEIIESKNKLQYATLVFCLLNGGKIPRLCTSDVLEQPNIEEVRKLYLSDKAVEQLYDTLLDKAKEMDNWMLTQTEDHYEFYHQYIFDAMREVHSNRYPQHIQTFCEVE